MELKGSNALEAKLLEECYWEAYHVDCSFTEILNLLEARSYHISYLFYALL